MTKYILVSGCLSHYRDQIPAYTKEIFADTTSKVKILWCMFATSKAKEETKYQNYRTLYDPYFNEGREVGNKLATEESFVEEVNWADVIIIHGGGNDRLRIVLAQYDLKGLFAGKTVVAHSSAANYLSISAWSPGGRKVVEGRGVIPIKLVTHFRTIPNEDDRIPTDWDAVVRELAATDDVTLPLLTLQDGEFSVYVHEYKLLPAPSR